MPEIPRAFLCYGTEDETLAEKIASAMQSNGIDTWWAPWCIGPGDSLRRKIDEGLGDCTHFIVLLTPTSIEKNWVNHEMDAGLIRKLGDRCKFIPLRYKLSTSQLPPLLSGMSSPEVVDPEKDIGQLINDIHGITRTKLATTSWLFVTFGEPGMGLLPTTHGIGSKWTCWRLVRHLLPLIPLQRSGASASSPPASPKVTKSQDPLHRCAWKPTLSRGPNSLLPLRLSPPA